MKYDIYAEFPSGATYRGEDCEKRDGKPITAVEDGVIVLRFTDYNGQRMKIVGASSCIITEVKD